MNKKKKCHAYYDYEQLQLALLAGVGYPVAGEGLEDFRSTVSQATVEEMTTALRKITRLLNKHKKPTRIKRWG